MSTAPRPTSYVARLQASFLPGNAAIETGFSSAASMIQLPGEVVHLVCSLLGDEDLLSLGGVSRYLHIIAYTAYLARHGLTDVGDLRSEDTLRAVRSALFGIRFRRLVVPFQLSQTADARTRLLDKVAHAQEVRVKMGHIKRPCATADTYLSAGDSTPKWNTTLERDWAKFARDLLVKAECQSILVEADSQNFRVLAEEIERAALGGLCSSVNTAYRLILSPFRWLGFSNPKLETFHVHCSLLFHPSLYHWTISTLRLPSLTSVSFDHLQHITPDLWHLLLPRISIPNLSTLSMNVCSMAPDDLYRFLVRHPSIEDLTLGSNLPHLDLRTTPLPKNALPNLRSLTASAEHLVPLLASPLHPFPTLKRVHVLYRTRRGSLFMCNAINNELAPICFRLRSVSEVELSISLESGAVDWLVGGHHGLLEMPPSDEDNDINNVNGDGNVIGRQPSTSITFTGTCVTRLEVKVHQFVLSPSIVLALPKWLPSFQGKTARFDLVTLASSFGRGPRSYGSSPFEMPSHKDVFLRAVAKHCTSVKQVYVDGEQEKVPSGRALSGPFL